MKAQIATFALSLLEDNLRDGCPYFIVNWKDRKIKLEEFYQINDINNELIINDIVRPLREYVIFQQERLVDKSFLNKYIESETVKLQSLENYYYACMTNNNKSKYFFLFIIIECYEGSTDFNNIVENELLFSKDDKEEVMKIVSKFEKRKKDIICNVFNRTKLSRKEKLFNYFEKKSLSVIKNKIITIETISNIIDQRNKLFHTSIEFDEDLLYTKLFPLIKSIINEIEFGFA